MAIDTNNEKLAIMEWCQVWEPGLPFDPVTIDQAAQQQFLWDYPGILWGELVDSGTDYLYWFRRKIHGQT